MVACDEAAVVAIFCTENMIMKDRNIPLYTTRMKVAELIESDYNLLLLFPRFGLELGVGDSTVSELCIRQGVSPQLFVMMCNIYSHTDYMPSADDVRQLDVEQLLGYLSRSHTYYVVSRIKPIEEQLKALSAQCSQAHSAVLQRFFAEYEQEVLNHFSYEENTVFPYIRTLMACHKMQPTYDIETFSHNHSNIDDKLCDLKNILVKHLRGIGMAAQTTELLFQIFSLEEDLSRHTFIEDVVLIPLVQHLEKTVYDN